MRLLSLCAALAVLAALPVAHAQTFLTVNSIADDANARDKAPGDGVCEDTFTDANPDAEPRCTLRAAIDEANATAGVVVIDLPGEIDGSDATYTLARVAPNDPDNTYEDDNAYGDLDLGGAFSTLTLRGIGTPGPQITQSPNDRVLHLLSGTVNIERVEITGGTARAGDNGVSSPGEGESVDGEDGADGGCVLVASGVTADLDQVSVNNCATQSGGNGAAPAASNTAGGNAGNGGNGGGIANYGTLSVSRSFVAENGTGDAGSPGNGTSGDGSPVAGGDGGNGGSGGGIFNAGTLTVQETTVWGNTGGDPSEGSTGTNGGPDGAEGEGGSGAGIATLDGGTVTLRNTIVAVNTAGDDPANGKQPGSDLWDGTPADDDAPEASFTPGSFTDGGSNLVGTNDAVEGAFPAGEPNANGSLVGTGQQDAPARIDPLIQGLNLNDDEAVRNLPLGNGSPAVDAGANTDLSGDDIRVDGRGFERPGTSEGDTTVDIGGYEADSAPAQDGSGIVLEADGPEAFAKPGRVPVDITLFNESSAPFDGNLVLVARSSTGRVVSRQAFAEGVRIRPGGEASFTQRFTVRERNASGVYDVTIQAEGESGGVLASSTFPIEITGAESAAAPEASVAEGVPAELSVAAAPNPARGPLAVTVGVPEAGSLSVGVFDVRGRRVAALFEGEAAPGVLALRSAPLPAGVYVVRVQTPAETLTLRATVVR